MGYGAQSRKDAFNIVSKTNEIGKHHIIKTLAERKIFGISSAPLKMGIFFSSNTNHRGADINAEPAGRLEMRKQISRSRSNFQHAALFRNNEPQKPLKRSVIIPVARFPVVACLCVPIKIFYKFILFHKISWIFF